MVDLLHFLQHSPHLKSTSDIQHQLDTIGGILQKAPHDLLLLLLQQSGALARGSLLLPPGPIALSTVINQRDSSGNPVVHRSFRVTKSLLIMPPQVLRERAEALKQLMGLSAQQLASVLGQAVTLLLLDPVMLKLKYQMLRHHLVDDGPEHSSHSQQQLTKILLKRPQVRRGLWSMVGVGLYKIDLGWAPCRCLCMQHPSYEAADDHVAGF